MLDRCRTGRRSGLRLELAAGPGGADREIKAAAVSELAEPGPWLQGGELLLTIGLLLPKTATAASLPRGPRRRRGAGARAGPGCAAAPPGGAGRADHRRRRDRHAAAHRARRGAVHRGHEAVFALPRPRRAQVLEWALESQRALTAAAVTRAGSGPLAAYRQATGATAVVVDLLGRVLPNPIPAASNWSQQLRHLLDSVRARGWVRRRSTSAAAAAANCTRSARDGCGRGC